jgi:uncharacterized protein with von Willebrand factor type A (vWA) domain
MLETTHSGKRNVELMDQYLKKIATGWLAEEGGIGSAIDDEDEELLRKSLSNISAEETPQALRLIEVLVRRILSASDRKYLRKSRRGMPDLRATIHASLRTGGIPVHPVYKKRPRTSRRIVVLCDVSESMYRFSEFALTFITALSRSNGKVRGFLFSTGAEEINLSDLSHFERTVKQSGLWRGGTDIGEALETIQMLKPPVVDPSVLLIVLSDAKTIAQGRADAALRDISHHTKEIVWLNPNREFSAFAEILAESCTMLCCYNLEELALACAKVSESGI